MKYKKIKSMKRQFRKRGDNKPPPGMKVSMSDIRQLEYMKRWKK